MCVHKERADTHTQNVIASRSVLSARAHTLCVPARQLAATPSERAHPSCRLREITPCARAVDNERGRGGRRRRLRARVNQLTPMPSAPCRVDLDAPMGWMGSDV
jgi:hypothetical protein